MVLQRILIRGIVQLKTKPSYHINMGLFLKTWNIQARKIMTFMLSFHLLKFMYCKWVLLQIYEVFFMN